MRQLIPGLLICMVTGSAYATVPVLTAHVDPHDAQSWQFSLALDRPGAIQLVCEEDGGRHERHVVARTAGLRHEVTIRGLKAATPYTCRADLGGSSHSTTTRFRTASLPYGLIPPTVTLASSNLAETGYTLYNYAYIQPNFQVRHANLVIADAEGNVRWYYSGVGGDDIDASFTGDGVAFGGWDGDFITPSIVGLDKQVQFKATTAHASPYELDNHFNHDAGISADGKSIFTLTQTQIDSTWLGFVVKQIDIASNTITWSWDSETDGVDLGLLPVGSADVTDPYHNNSVQDRWENGRLYVYVGLRDLSQVLKIDYLTGQIVNRLGIGGDYRLLEPDGSPAQDFRWFFNQHDAQRVGDRLTVYDNGSDRTLYGGNIYTRALQLQIDETNKTVRIVLEYTEPDWYEPAWGGNDYLPDGNTLVALGHCWRCGGSPHKSALIELDAAAQPLWRAEWQDPRIGIYRAEHIDGCAIFNNATYCPALARQH